MITFRFYLISVISFFLALTIGIVMGTTVVDKAVVNSLRTRINTVAANADERRAENEKLKDYINQIQSIKFSDKYDFANVGIYLTFSKNLSQEKKDAITKNFSTLNIDVYESTMNLNGDSQFMSHISDIDPKDNTIFFEFIALAKNDKISKMHRDFINGNTTVAVTEDSSILNKFIDSDKNGNQIGNFESVFARFALIDLIDSMIKQNKPNINKTFFVNE